MDRFVSVVEAARIKKVTRQAIYLAIRLNRLKAYKYGDTLKIYKADLEAYDALRYSRENYKYDGEVVFDEKKGLITIKRAAEIVGVPHQKLYHAVRTGKLKAARISTAWVVHLPDLIQYEERYLKRELSRKSVAG